MMTKNRTQFVFIIAAGLSLISGFSQTAHIGKSDASSGNNTTTVEHSYIVAPIAVAHLLVAIIAAIIVPTIMAGTIVVSGAVIGHGVTGSAIGSAIGGAIGGAGVGVGTMIAAVGVHGTIDTNNEIANKRQFYQYQRKFSECLREHAGEGGPAEVPPVCEEALRKLVATAHQVRSNKLR